MNNLNKKNNDFSKLEEEGEIYTKITEETKEISKGLELGEFQLEQDNNGNYYLVLYMDFEDFGDEEDEMYYNAFIESIFGSMKHFTVYDGENEIYQFPIHDNNIEQFFTETLINAIKSIKH